MTANHLVHNRLVRRRLVHDRIARAFCLAAAMLGLCALALILFTLVGKGLAGIGLATFTHATPPPGQAGGLANALYGSLVLTALAVLAGAPIGILTGIYLAEYGGRSPLAACVRFINDILLSAPSIVIGLFVYQIMVVPMRHFSGWAGVAALALIVIPIVARAGEDMLRLVPGALRESAAALGAPRHVIILRIAVKAARAGLITGVLLATARISGETAPLLFTALNNQFWSTDLDAPMASLPMMIYQFALSPFAEWQQLAWTGALILTVAVLGLGIAARLSGPGRHNP